MSIKTGLTLMIKQLILSLIALTLSACLMIGETAAKITGEIIDQNGLAYSQCSIDLLRVDGTNKTRLNYTKRQISFNGKKFEQIFVLQPNVQKLSVEIACADSAMSFISKPLDLSGGFDTPVNLGSIILRRE